jgi:formamidopyrimidine-DNA glycosylase
MWEGPKLERSCAGRHETVKNGEILWGWRTQAEFIQDANEAFEAAIHGHYFANVEAS